MTAPDLSAEEVERLLSPKLTEGTFWHLISLWHDAEIGQEAAMAAGKIDNALRALSTALATERVVREAAEELLRRMRDVWRADVATRDRLAAQAEAMAGALDGLLICDDMGQDHEAGCECPCCTARTALAAYRTPPTTEGR